MAGSLIYGVWVAQFLRWPQGNHHWHTWTRWLLCSTLGLKEGWCPLYQTDFQIMPRTLSKSAWQGENCCPPGFMQIQTCLMFSWIPNSCLRNTSPLFSFVFSQLQWPETTAICRPAAEALIHPPKWDWSELYGNAEKELLWSPRGTVWLTRSYTTDFFLLLWFNADWWLRTLSILLSLFDSPPPTLCDSPRVCLGAWGTGLLTQTLLETTIQSILRRNCSCCIVKLQFKNKYTGSTFMHFTWYVNKTYKMWMCRDRCQIFCNWLRIFI